MDKIIDLRSDTLTCPDAEMRQAMAAAVGDDCHGEDPTVAELERLAAERIGKEAALFVPTGTMGNTSGLMACCGAPGSVVIAERYNHVSHYEREGMERVAGLKFLIYEDPSGIPDPRTIEGLIRKAKQDSLPLRALAIENTFNVRDGICVPPERMKALCDLAHSHGLKVHLDGARIFNAATYLGCDVKDLARHVDTVMFCLSKGLGAPVGSMIASDAATRKVLHRCRKMLGGGMRQSGILAAAGILALTKGAKRLAEDHQNARVLAEGLASVPGLRLDLGRVQTNIVMMHLDSVATAEKLRDRAKERGVKFGHVHDGMCRLVTYNAITRSDAERAVAVIRSLMKDIQS